MRSVNTSWVSAHLVSLRVRPDCTAMSCSALHVQPRGSRPNTKDTKQRGSSRDRRKLVKATPLHVELYGERKLSQPLVSLFQPRRLKLAGEECRLGRSERREPGP